MTTARKSGPFTFQSQFLAAMELEHIKIFKIKYVNQRKKDSDQKHI